MITERDAEPGREEQHRGDGKVKPINTEVPQVRRHSGQREKESPDQERARRPINPIGGNAKGQEIVRSFNHSPAKPSPWRRLRHLRNWSTKDNVRFCPGVN